ncbi:MAG: tail fiber domain-containing protein, partial [bacterium]
GNIINTGTATSAVFNLATTGVVTLGTSTNVTNANITIDAFGRIVSATSGSSTGAGGITAITPGIGLSTSADGTSSANITATGTLYSTLSIGIGSNQTIYGGANGGGTLTLSSTASTSKGKILFGTSGYDEANNFLGLGTASPVSLLSVVGAPTATSTYGLVSIGNGGFALGGSNFNGTATGTQIALNATSTFAGNLIDLQVGGVSKFKIDSSGNLTASSSMTAGGGNFAFTSGINPVFTVGDVAAAGNRVKFTVDDGTANQKITAQARTFTFQTNAASPKTFLYINTATSGSIQLGDVGGLHNYGYLDITGTTTSGNWAATIKDGLGNPYFEVQPYTGTYQLGSLASGRAGANNTALYINDATANDGTLAGKSSAIFANNSFSVRDATASSSVYFLADAANRLYELGDIGGASLGGVAGSGTALVINDTAKTILLTSNGVPVSTSTALVEIGTGMFATSTTGGFSGSAVGTQFAINAASGFTGSLADVQVAGVSKFKLDYNGNLTLPSTGSLILTATGTNLVTIKGSTSTTQSYTLTLPTATGTTGQVLATDGTGNLSWATTASIPGSTWSMTASGIYTATNVAYGNGMFVAVDGLYNSIAISYNGTVWKQIGTFGSFTASPNVVAYGNGMFVTANAIGGGEYISTDGLNWTLRTSASTGLPAVGCYTLAYGNGVFFEAYNGAPNSYYSTDGLNWTATTPPVGVGRGPAAYGNGKWVFLPAGNVAETTTNFSTYATSTIVNSAYPLRTWVSLAYGNGLFVGVNWDGTATSSIVTSTDGVTWTAQNAPIQTLNNVTYGAGLFTAVSGVSGASNAIITSPDGVTWTIRTVTPYISQSLSTVAYGNGVFVALDGHNGGTATYYSGVPYTTTTQYNNTYVGGIFSMGNIGIGTTSPISALNIVNIPTATTTFGVVSVGDGGFAGGANNFAGSAAGTQIAVNATSTFTGSLIDLQRGGTSRFNVNGAGNIAVGSSTALDPFSIGTAVPSGATHALFNLANLALVGASATGTYIGANPTTFTGDFENYEVAGVSKFSISSTGVITATSDAIIDGVTVGTGKQTGVGNTVLGAGALNVSTSTSANDVAIGFGALAKDFSAGFNTAVGYQAMGTTATTGAQKSSVFGWKAGFALGSGGSSAGEANTFLGYESGFAMTTGSWNTIIGGYNGTNGLTMGYGSGVGGSTGNNLVMLGDGRYNTAASGTGIRFISDALGDVAIGGGVSGNGLNPTATPLAGGVSAGGGLTIVPYGYAQLGASDIPTIFRIDGNLATYTGVYLNPASAEQNDVLIDLNRTVTFDRTSINTLQRAMVIKAPNYEASVGGTFTLTGYAATMAISGAPAAGLRYLIGTSTAFYIGSNNVTASTTNSYGAIINAQTGGTNNYASAFMGGNVGIGTMAPTAPLEVYTAGATVAKFTGSGGVTSCIISSSVLTCSSDVRLKKNIDNINYGLADIMKLRPVDYNWKFEADGSTKSLGFIAQEVEAVIPNLVTTDPDTGYKQLNTIGMAPILTKAIQEMDLKLEPLTSLDPAQDGSLASLIKKYLQDALNGIQTLFANKVQTNELCLQDVCVTKNQLQQLLNQANINSSNNTNGQGQLPGTLPTIDTSTTTTTSTTTSTSTIVVDTATSTTTSSSSSTSTSTTDTTTGTTAVDSSVVPPVVAPVDPTVTP